MLTKVLKPLTLLLRFFKSASRIRSDRRRNTMLGFFEHVKSLQFSPNIIIDVGVATGTYEMYRVYPDSYYLLIEPLVEFNASIKNILRQYRGEHISAAASDVNGSLVLNVHADHLDGSSLLKEGVETAEHEVERVVETFRIDDVIAKKNLSGPFLIKIDVQGAELDVLKGAPLALINAEVVVLEVSLFPFMRNSPQLFDVVTFMKQAGFVTYDLFGYSTRPLDNALGQIDMVFVKEHGFFRSNNSYA